MCYTSAIIYEWYLIGIAHNIFEQLGCIFGQVLGFLPCKTTIREDSDRRCLLEPCFWLVLVVDFHDDALTRQSAGEKEEIYLEFYNKSVGTKLSIDKKGSLIRSPRYIVKIEENSAV